MSATEYSTDYDDGRAFARSELARLEAENAKLARDRLTLQAANEIYAGRLVRAEAEIAKLRESARVFLARCEATEGQAFYERVQPELEALKEAAGVA